MTIETLEQKQEYWNNLQAKTQTKKIEHQSTKVSTDEQISEDLWTEIMIAEANRMYWRFPNEVA